MESRFTDEGRSYKHATSEGRRTTKGIRGILPRKISKNSLKWNERVRNILRRDNLNCVETESTTECYRL